jgi:hypothetical protein
VDLRESTLFVQLLSPTIPRRPPGMSTPQLQYTAAQAVPGLPLLQWRDRKLDLANHYRPRPTRLPGHRHGGSNRH